MSYKITVDLSQHSYPIYIGRGLFAQLRAEVERIKPEVTVIITDSKVQKLWASKIAKEIPGKVMTIAFPHGEKFKTQKTVTMLQETMLKKRVPRKSLVIALGGGVAGDVAGFVAATYMRGVPYIQVPTSLLAMVDSSIGGKVGIDTKYGKNMIGAFYQPRAVIIDVDVLETLPKEHVVNGLMESVKMFFTSNAAALPLVEKIDTGAPLSTPQPLIETIHESLKIKAGVVMRDEKEMGERKILNFGHTIGHALELVSNFKILHGYAVAYGMLAESRIAVSLGALSPADQQNIVATLKRFGIESSQVKKYAPKKILAAAMTDKKTQDGQLYFVILNGTGSVKTEGGYAHTAPNNQILEAL